MVDQFAEKFLQRMRFRNHRPFARLLRCTTLLNILMRLLNLILRGTQAFIRRMRLPSQVRAGFPAASPVSLRRKHMSSWSSVDAGPVAKVISVIVRGLMPYQQVGSVTAKMLC